MAVGLLIIFTFIFLLYSSCCFGNYSGIGKHMFLKVERLKVRARQLYGEAVRTPKEAKLSVDFEDRLAYPRGDIQKLYEISEQWVRYYECCARTLRDLTPAHALPARSVCVYAGAVARLPCGVCVAPGETDAVAWFYAESLKNLTFVPMEEKASAVIHPSQLTIYHARPEDTGVYRCQVGNSSGGVVVLEVVDNEENYTVVKPPQSHGPYAAPAVADGKLIVFTNWSPWSECSRCSRWGRRRRFGMCYVKVRDRRSRSEEDTINPRNCSLNHTKGPQLCIQGRVILEAFPLGCRCRSRVLPPCITNRSAVRDRPNEIMIGMCKPPCERRTTDHKVELRQVNNSEDIFSLLHTSRKEMTRMQNREPQSAVVFAVRGQPATIACPGAAPRDMPVSWRVGAARAGERSLAARSAGRVRVTARDHLAFAAVWDSDANVYSCWQRDVLVGRTRLCVWAGREAGRAGAVAVLALAAYLLPRGYRAVAGRGG